MDDGLRLERVAIRQGEFALSADLSVKPGRVTAVMGPSGGGKSTLLSAVAGFVPHVGRILWAGADITRLRPGDRPVSILFQDNNLFPHLTVAQNIGLGRSPRLRLTGADHAEVSAVLARLGLAGMEGRKPAQLSGGQQSRVALGRVLMAERPVVLLDEPFAALGPAMRQEMLALAAEVLIGAGRTVLMVTHDPADARQVAEAVIVISEGVARPPVSVDLALDPEGPLRAYLGAG